MPQNPAIIPSPAKSTHRPKSPNLPIPCAEGKNKNTTLHADRMAGSHNQRKQAPGVCSLPSLAHPVATAGISVCENAPATACRTQCLYTTLPPPPSFERISFSDPGLIFVFSCLIYEKIENRRFWKQFAILKRAERLSNSRDLVETYRA